MTARDELNAIGEALVEIAADHKAIPARRVGDLIGRDARTANTTCCRSKPCDEPHDEPQSTRIQRLVP
jgi:hypothetical protein